MELKTRKLSTDNLSSPHDLDFWPTQMKNSNGTSTYYGKQLCQITCISNSIQSCRSYGPDKNLTFKGDLDLGPTWTNVSNGTSTHGGEQLCQIILKSIHNCKSYGLHKFEYTKLSMWKLCLTHCKRAQHKTKSQKEICSIWTFLSFISYFSVFILIICFKH